MTIRDPWEQRAFGPGLPDMLERNAAQWSDRLALSVDGRPVTHGDLKRRSIGLARGYHELGVGQGDVVATFMSNAEELVYSYHACWYLGAIHVALNTSMRGAFLAQQLKTALPKLVIADEEFVPRILEVAEGIPSLRHIVVRAGGSSGFASGSQIAFHSADELRLDADRVEWELPSGYDTLCGIMFTGGTTGPSKGVATSKGYVMSFASRTTRNIGFDSESVFYQPTPMFHISGAYSCILAPAISGGTGHSSNKFSASGYLDTMRATNASHGILFGPLAVMLWNQPERENDADTNWKVNYAYMQGDLLEPFSKRFGVKIVATYSLSETIPVTLDHFESPSPPGKSSKPVDEFDVRIFDDNDNELPTGTPGEIVVRPRRPYAMSSGYYNNPEATVEAWRNLWFHTGDIGKFDDEGYLIFVDRKADYIRRRGINISCWDLEEAIRAYQLVADAAVHGVESELGEEDVKACLVLREGVEFDVVAFWDFCVANMPYYAVPRYVDVLSELPRSPIGRVTKYVLRDNGNTSITADRDAMGYVVKK
jgi:crotonobetaine/carnitine-CoA ligase